MKQKGFTLLEMLLVLFAISVLSMVTYFHVHSLYEKQKIEQFLRQFSNDILYMQQLAINRQKHYTLRWHKDRHMYYIGESSTDHSIIKREYDSDIQLDLNTFPNPMTYNPSGNINRGGTILLSYRSYKYEIVFQLGRGRFTYREMSKRVSDG
ncbi:comG operon protein ComGD [Bacillus paranthracis]|uniref:ComG operon protein ComGD n=3 Tax=Bacillus cereus group TaxID=86661 RepID=A0A4P9EUL4_9BACI|nr:MULTISPECIES: comG operon protein ComGD [Bacillus]ACJ77483.1 comG operon protein 4 [Bacillus cereus AH187]ACM14452.1 comG operon protein 4 [Bacillus cereus Q1]EDZ55224.1 comG operon protein 4 [Bacillus cereus H3081.97]EJP94511.1 prepilin-type N-terminal cleavage/methylation domain-containing protein [Bacillus cereus IS075]EJR10514.1 prepilin-type N-terminal cleavage/methylation domain-containing protein [Bacillus cereus MSX-A12]EOO94083.1 prepilin-type N-terminal cleavage/methylation domai